MATAEQMRAQLIREALEMDGVTVEDQIKIIKAEKELLEKHGHEWHGEERRGIPLHILNYMDDRLKTHTEHIEKVFNDYTAEEMERYNAILNKIEDGQKSAVARHEAVMEVVGHFNGKCKDVHSAFLKTPEGEYDFEGHRNDHYTRKTVAEWWGRTKGSVAVKLIEYGVMGLVAWIGLLVWEAFVKGPAK